MTMYDHRSGRRISEYRKREFGFGGIPTLTAPSIELMAGSLGHITQVKHIRGFVTLASTSNASTTTIRGFICLVRYPRLEQLSLADLHIDASYVLHPVPFAITAYPQAVPYEHVGVTLGNEEQLYMAVRIGAISGGWTLNAEFIYDARIQPVLS